MAFSTYKELGDVLLEYQIRYQVEAFTFSSHVSASATLTDEINFVTREFAFRGSEAAVCESLLFPILKAAWKPYVHRLTLWSHKPLYDESGLLGTPDYTLTKRSSLGAIVFEGPYVAVIEAKRDDFTGGWGQCMLEMLALRRLNHQPALPVYGIVSNGRSWEIGYLLADVFTLYNKTLFLENLDELMSGLMTIFESCIKNLDNDAASVNGGL